jgi:hypothetical protein
VSELSREALLDVLGDLDYVRREVNRLVAERDRYRRQLDEATDVANGLRIELRIATERAREFAGEVARYRRQVLRLRDFERDARAVIQTANRMDPEHPPSGENVVNTAAFFLQQWPESREAE